MQPTRRLLQPQQPNTPENDARAARQEKLAAIRRAIDAGHYDNDDILEKAFNRMLQRVQSERSGE
jgi:anti-sigma28 factor (negative regulator of flagellin synthesis)